MIYKFGKDIVNTAADLTETQNVVDTAFKQSAGEIEQWSKEAINKFGLSELAAKKYASRIMAMSNSMEISHQNGLILSKNIAQLSADLASFYNTDVSDAFESLNAIFTGQIRTLRRYGLNISEANLENYRLSKGIKTAYTAMSEQQKVLLRYNYVMEHTKDIQGDFAKTQMTFANQVKLAKMNFASLAGTLGSFLIPVLSTILRYLNAIIVAINSFFGRLAKIAGVQLQHFGGGVELTDGIADGWDNAAGAAAKYKATIAGFDELETLNPQSSGGGGGAGGGGLSGEDLFPDGLLSYDVEDNTQALDVSFNNLIKLIDEKINEIREKSDTLASTFGKNVNGIINYVDWPMIGQTVGDGFNLVTSAVNRFMEEIDFHNLGEKFASSVNSIFDTVDFEETGHKLSLKFNAIIDTVNGFVGKLDFDSIAAGILTHFKTALAEIKWEQAGETLAMGINKVFGLLDDLLNGNIVADLGTKIGVAINTAVANIDAAQIGRVADGFAKQIIAAIKEIDWKLIGDKLAEAFKEANIIGNLIEAIKTAIGIKINVEGGIFAGLFNLPPGVGKAIIAVATGIGLLASAIGKVVAAIAPFIIGLVKVRIALSGLLVLFAGLNMGKPIGEIVVSMGSLVKALVTGEEKFYTFSKLLKVLGKSISTFFSAKLAPVIAAFSKAGTAIKTILSAFISGVKTILIGAGTKLIAGVGTVLGTVKTAILTALTTIKAGITTALAAIKTALTTAVTWLLAHPIVLITAAIVALVILIAKKGEEIKAALQKVDDWLQNIFAKDWTNVFGPVLGGVLNGFLDIMKGFWDGVKTNLMGWIDFIRGVFTGDWERAWNGVKEIFGGAFKAMIALAKAPLNAIIGLVNAFLGGITRGYNRLTAALSGVENPITGHTITMKGVPYIQIPYLANGGVIDSPTVAMLGEYANAKNNPEIAAPQSLIQAIIDNSNGDVISANSQFARQIIAAIENKDFFIQIGDDTIAASAQRGNKNYQRRTGQPLFGL